ncbi:hypothetical protein E2493_15170 [Sphingomonas parva]|uniref:DUF1794 domain-containing protein n=1 Tax=Sphingomonas parva TaxID=2555898 RepID=A0A4Y8ZN34_9SPHN|nr:hypothetical protein [Sphingomonas parva]TFI57418.1 hypothetical protein E2493_15170 [Sphingomonas parva]
MRTISLIVATAGCMLLAAAPAGAEGDADPLAPLKPLVGRWQGISSSGRRLDISYRLIANDSVLVETWRSPSGRETMTVYHRDGARLLATHYCAQGNQPRLRLTRTERSGRMHFAFADATNLPSQASSHLHDFWIEPIDAQTLKRSETYRENGVAEEESALLTRNPAP